MAHKLQYRKPPACRVHVREHQPHVLECLLSYSNCCLACRLWTLQPSQRSQRGATSRACSDSDFDQLNLLAMPARVQDVHPLEQPAQGRLTFPRLERPSALCSAPRREAGPEGERPQSFTENMSVRDIRLEKSSTKQASGPSPKVEQDPLRRDHVQVPPCLVHVSLAKGLAQPD